MQPASPPVARASTSRLHSGGFAILAFGGLLGILSLSSAELENTSQAALYGTSAFVVGAIGAAAAIVGAFRGRA